MYNSCRHFDEVFELIPHVLVDFELTGTINIKRRSNSYPSVIINMSSKRKVFDAT
jgi:hypothetical protein